VPETTGIEKTIYVLSKPLIDKNNQRWENSRKRTVRISKSDVPEEDTDIVPEEIADVLEKTDEDTCSEAESTKQADSFKPAPVREVMAQVNNTSVSERIPPSVKDGTNLVFTEGPYKNVRLNVAEKCRIINEIGFLKYSDCVKYLSEYLHNNPYLDSGDHMEDILGWVVQKVDGISLSG